MKGATTMWNEFGSSLLSFVMFFGSGVISVIIYTVIYTAITPHKEFALIKDQNQAAAIAFAGSLLGFVIVIARLIQYSVNIVDFYLWVIVAIIVQLIAYGVVRLTFPRLSDRIASGELSAAIWLAGLSIGAGLLNAASLTP
jgi:putative membrane protein